MEDNNKTREVELDEIKEVCDEQTSSMIDETVSDMLKFVQRYDSKEDYEFCKNTKQHVSVYSPWVV